MNGMISLNGSAPSITSREIAELVESRHDNVRVTVERLAERGVIALPAMQEKPTGGRPTQEYVFSGEAGKRDSIVVVAQLSPEFTARLVDRWQELEARAHRDPMEVLADPAAMRGLLLTYTEKVLALEGRVAEQAPKVEAFDRIATSDGGMCVSNAAKHLQTRPKDLFAWLRAHRWIYRRAGGTAWLAYQERLQAGLLEHKVATIERGDGSVRTVEQVRVTPKGLARLSETLNNQEKVA